jgi:hypothetical protein
MIQNQFSTTDWVLAFLTNLERNQLTKAERTRLRNHELVRNYLTGFTNTGGKHSAIILCESLGVDPYGITFLN